MVLEFKVGETGYSGSAATQVWDYALDLKNFHRGSRDVAIVPVLVATEAKVGDTSVKQARPDGIHDPHTTSALHLAELVGSVRSRYGDATFNSTGWAREPYLPTPTIIEAARAMYSSHQVENITRNDAGAKNLSTTTASVERVIHEMIERKGKAIVFVTGVPGAGKTLVGLNIATKKIEGKEKTHAVFLSGNGPLVKVLREALVIDEHGRRGKNSAAGSRKTKSEIRQNVKAFIQNVHHFRDEGVRDSAAPSDHVVVFDEAQRAWNQAQTAAFMKRKKGFENFAQSEPAFLVSYMNRHVDWAVVVCLVGGGQEINTGEAGISAWLEALITDFPNWEVYISPRLSDSEYQADGVLGRLSDRPKVFMDEGLHLDISMRSFKAEALSGFIKAVLDLEIERARGLLRSFANNYPIVITRDLVKAKGWVKSRARGSERFGLLASSSARRLKPHAIDVRMEIDPVHWFLHDANDTRSSFYLEDPATEFQVQGLEVDWACVTWDADFRFNNDGWSFHSFVGSKWQRVRQAQAQQYLKNAYRVLLTRARQGIVIFVPEGDDSDPTRSPALYDHTYDLLLSVGLTEIP
ncbi:DUF2075 domain-containing protein [Nibricoccus sp. IMCC34717]|uniref:DUF2075 domain-containing protein n=1 Tax=Nibricoccus sp. IMCC34717 TaxID=3034021 RepID=UPI00384CD382